MRRNNTVYALSVIALMIAIMFIFGFTPLGTIQTLGLSITLMGIPVAIIACLFGPWMGALAGAIWGTISLIQAFAGMDATGTLLLSADPSVIPDAVKFGGLIAICYCRIFVGFLTGLIYDALRLIDKKGYIAPFFASMSTAILNTVFFMSFFCLFFYQTGTIQDFCLSAGLPTENAFMFVVALVGVNFFAEFGTNAVIGGAASLGLTKAAEHMSISSIFPHFWTKPVVASVED